LNVHLYNSWERLPCDVSCSCSLLRTWLLSIGWLDLQESVWFGGCGRFGELRTSTFEVLHVYGFADLSIVLLPCCCRYKSDRNPSKIEACALQNHPPRREIRSCIFERAMRISMRIIICGEGCCD
jgi:hypothetical protein